MNLTLYAFFSLGDKVQFEIDPKVNPTLRELLKRITPLCSHYSIVVSFVERHTLMGSGKFTSFSLNAGKIISLQGMSMIY